MDVESLSLEIISALNYYLYQCETRCLMFRIDHQMVLQVNLNFFFKVFSKTKHSKKFIMLQMTLTLIFQILKTMKRCKISTINKTKRVTRKTATAIDHIPTNTFVDGTFKSDIFKSDVSNDFPVIFVIPSVKLLNKDEIS